MTFQFFRNAETYIRKLPRVSLVSLEPAEIAEMMHRDGLKQVINRLVIVDRDSRVGETALRALSPGDERFSFVQFDLSATIPWRMAPADMVVAYFCVERTGEPVLAMRHIRSMLKPGGLLSTTIEVPAGNFEAIDQRNGLYRLRG